MWRESDRDLGCTASYLQLEELASVALADDALGYHYRTNGQYAYMTWIYVIAHHRGMLALAQPCDGPFSVLWAGGVDRLQAFSRDWVAR